MIKQQQHKFVPKIHWYSHWSRCMWLSDQDACDLYRACMKPLVQCLMSLAEKEQVIGDMQGNKWYARPVHETLESCSQGRVDNTNFYGLGSDWVHGSFVCAAWLEILNYLLRFYSECSAAGKIVMLALLIFWIWNKTSYSKIWRKNLW